MTIELLNMDCVEYMAGCDDNAFDAIITDPPYFKVKREQWDNSWADSEQFLQWIDSLCQEFARILTPNGSLYIFASPHMAGRVEVVVREHLSVLNSIVWRKGKPGYATQGWFQKASKESLRQFIPETERIIFAEHYNSDNIAKGEAGYFSKCDELRGFVFEPLRAYMAEERDRAGMTTRAVAKMYQKKTGSKTVTGMASHWFTRSQWALPTKENYLWLRDILNASGGDYLRRDYEDLRRDYEDLRRPFCVTEKDQFSDVWDFDPVQAYPGKHPCEKPQALWAHILQSSVRQGARVYDPFMGSGSLAIAAHYFGCDFVGCEIDADYYAAAVERFNNETKQVAMF